jgi:2-phosphoglycerate kinase
MITKGNGMIYLIGGSPRCGKTILARKLSDKLRVSWISADALESIVRRYIPKERIDELMPKDVFRRIAGNSNDMMYSKYSAEEISAAYIAQSKASWVAVETLIACMLADGQSIIIEGHQLHPELIAKIIQENGRDNIKAVVLTKTNVDDIVETSRKSKEINDWFIQKTSDENIHYKIAEMLSKYSIFYSSEAKKYDVEEINYRGNFEEQIVEAEEYLMA